MPSPFAASLTVDLDALAHNFHAMRALASGAEVAPVVKADAYGLGLNAVARRLHVEGAGVFYVARVAEGEALREVLPRAEVRVLDGCPPGATEALRRAALIPVLSSLDQVEAWRGSGGGAAALMIDTGMNRLGLSVEEAHALADSTDRLRGVDLMAVLSQLACADDPGHPMNGTQRRAFEEASERHAPARRSLANSAGVLLGADFIFDEVRPGIALYGGGPRGTADPRLRAVATLEAPVLQLRTVRAGETVGYGASWTAPAATRVAVVAAGYADGVLRAGANGLYAGFDGRTLPVLGRLSMDLIALDAAEAPRLRPGDRVELLGPNAGVDAAARACGTVAYELLTRLSPRLERRYLGAA